MIRHYLIPLVLFWKIGDNKRGDTNFAVTSYFSIEHVQLFIMINTRKPNISFVPLQSIIDRGMDALVIFECESEIRLNFCTRLIQARSIRGGAGGWWLAPHFSRIKHFIFFLPAMIFWMSLPRPLYFQKRCYVPVIFILC